MVRSRLVLALSSGILTMAACSVKPDEPGLCALKCGNAILGPADPGVKIKKLTADPELTCDKGLAAPQDFGPVQVQFLVAEEIQDPTKAGADPTAGGGEPPVRGIPFISIEPVVTGAVSPTTFPEGKENDSRYTGLRTAASNWCSDSCGVVTVELVPTCLTAGSVSTVNVQVHSGALYSESVGITVTTPDDEI